MDFQLLREEMLRTIARYGVSDKAVLKAMREVPRHEFVPADKRPMAYEDRPLPIGYEQTISQPYMVALMSASLELKETDTVLEIGTGSGYQSAVLSKICREVCTVERIPELSFTAEKLFKRLGIKNIQCCISDGTQGCLAGGETGKRLFEGIMITAAAGNIPEQLLNQLAPGGRMVIPLGDFSGQVLTLITREENRFEQKEICRCVFVPLIGKFGLKIHE